MKTAPNAPSPHRTMATSLAQAIRADIIKGELEPGSKLRIKDLALRYAAGSIPVREALSRLANTGFVEAQDQRGFRVSAMSAEQLSDITETRVFIESEALRRSILGGGLEWEEQLVVTHHRMSRLAFWLPGNELVNPEWERAHHSFHIALCAACGSPWLSSLASLLREQTERYRNLSLMGGQPAKPKKPKPAGRDIASEHAAMLQAALQRDTGRACALLAQHIRRTSELALARQQQPE